MEKNVMTEKIKIKRALISCWDKKGIDTLAAALVEKEVKIISSGGTYKFLKDAGIAVSSVEEITGFPEILDGRVKTLHPLIHGAILARRTPAHLQQLAEHNIEPIDLVVVNLYPFLTAVGETGKTLEEMVELIDIGGPAILRAAAKNSDSVVVLSQPSQYEKFMEEFQKYNGEISGRLSNELAAEGFFYTSYYDSQIAGYLSSIQQVNKFPSKISLFFEKNKDLRYGENPHQEAALYQLFGGKALKEQIQQIHGKEMSFNNFVDVSAAFALVSDFENTAVAIIKHTNPCGVAESTTLYEAFDLAYSGDPLSAFGGIVATNREVDQPTAEKIQKSFFECIIAPSFSEEAFAILQKKKNLRLLKIQKTKVEQEQIDYKFLDLGLLVQDPDSLNIDAAKLVSVCDRNPTEGEREDLLFAWKVVKHVKSNAIVIAKNKQIIGVGAGQMSRVDSVQLACKKAKFAGHNLAKAVLASDAFFPFRDGVDEAAKEGIIAIIQPGGSIRDPEVIAAANEQGLSLLLTGIRHFKH
jgi:phosphoribosylaminoimidazolecarboxamide formyltransferase/IMP cyclohydrolase